MKATVAIVLCLVLFASCKQNSAFVCYICKSTVIRDSAGVKEYTNLPDYTPCSIDKAEVDLYQARHNSVDTIGGFVVDTTTLCSRF